MGSFDELKLDLQPTDGCESSLIALIGFEICYDPVH